MTESLTVPMTIAAMPMVDRCALGCAPVFLTGLQTFPCRLQIDACALDYTTRCVLTAHQAVSLTVTCALDCASACATVCLHALITVPLTVACGLDSPPDYAIDCVFDHAEDCIHGC